MPKVRYDTMVYCNRCGSQVCDGNCDRDRKVARLQNNRPEWVRRMQENRGVGKDMTNG